MSGSLNGCSMGISRRWPNFSLSGMLCCYTERRTVLEAPLPSCFFNWYLPMVPSISQPCVSASGNIVAQFSMCSILSKAPV